MLQNLMALAFLGVVPFVLSGVGLLICRRLAGHEAVDGQILFCSFGLGAGVTGYGVFFLAACGILTPVALSTLCLVLLIAALAGWRSCRIRLSLRTLAPSGVVEWGSAGILALVLLGSLLLSLTPEIGKDALLYHLAIPKLYLKHQGFYLIPGNTFANYPFHTEMLFLLGIFLHGDILAKMFAFAVVPVLLCGIGYFAKGIMARHEYPYLSMLVFLAIPSIFQISHMAYIDLYLTLYAMGALMAYISWSRGRNSGWLMVCAAFTGLAAACKYSTLLFPFLGFFGVVWQHRDDEAGGTVLRDLLLYCVVTLLVGAPFYIKNWLMTGNPVYPFMYGVFGGKGWDPELTRLFDGLFMYLGMGREWYDYLLLPWNVSMRAKMDSRFFDGVIGPIFLLALPLLVLIRRPWEPTVRLLLFCSALNFVFWGSTSQNIRYLAPVLPLLSLLVGYVLTGLRERKTERAFAGAVVAGSLLYTCSLIVDEFTRIRPLPVVAGMETRQEFLTRSLSVYKSYQAVNSLTPEESKVYLLYVKNFTYLCDRNCFADAMFEHYSLQKMLRSSGSPDDVRAGMVRMGITHLLLDQVRLLGENSPLSKEEVALFEAFRDRHLTLEHKDRSYHLYRM